MGFNLPEKKQKKWDAVLWVEAQYNHHFGECKSIWHRLFTGERAINCKRQPDGSSATIYVCNKCNGIKSSNISININL